MRKILSLLTFTLTSAAAVAQTLPTVTTDTRFARGATSAYGRLSVVANGNTIRERGFCWATHPQPTVDENKTTTYFSNQGAIYRLENLEPATIYYMRAYATTTSGTTAYGADIKFSTLPMGTVTYTYDFGAGDATVDNRIDQAVADAVAYWNRLTNITGFSTSVHWGASTPTADCSYGGWMRVGPNASYQRIGTIMHEMLHGIGVGTHWLWYGPSYMRANETRGAWLGDRAQDLIRFWDNNNTAILNGDKTHLWPYGINGAHEDNGTEQLYTITSLIAQAVGEDGLPCSTSRGFASPYYSFTQDDDTKYYIKSEDDKRGRASAFLVETATSTLKWVTMATETATQNDSAAWYLEFTPGNQYYQLRNAATGHYMTYNTSGTNGIRAAARPNGKLSADNFQLMRSRTDLVVGTGTNQRHLRGYWIIHPTSSANPPALAAATFGVCNTQALNLRDESTTQRWLIVTPEEAKAVEESGQQQEMDKLSVTLSHLRALLDVPHSQLTEVDADAYLADTLNSLEALAQGASAAIIDSLEKKAQHAATEFLGMVTPNRVEEPFDLTFRVKSCNFASNNTEGWSSTADPTANYDCVEFYEKTFDFYQMLDDMPAGTYELRVQGLSRPGVLATCWTSYKLVGGVRVNARLYVGTGTASSTRTSQRLLHIAECRQASALTSEDAEMDENLWVPNTMYSAAKYFEQGLYQNSVVRKVTAAQLNKSEGQMRIGLYDQSASESHWSIFTNVRLLYHGQTEASVVTPVDYILTNQPAEERQGVYSLTGQQVGDSLEGLAPGIYILNGKKVVKR